MEIDLAPVDTEIRDGASDSDNVLAELESPRDAGCFDHCVHPTPAG
jgi:hypothetical protein